MLFLVLSVIAVTVAAALYLVPATDATEHEEKPGTDGAEPTTLEGALVAQLIRGELSPVKYRGALARLAERDDERNPLSVPGEDRPDACP
ncbi:hypothetical protein [Actinoplanes sp. NPDC049802]|uniref:hypothetical protein n=1 Tax=Actinoplanes sp. NPDC049802 TaxID=3154742 RepID=UPI0033CEB2D0